MANPRTAWEGTDTARRFLGCPLEEVDQCDTLIWVDQEWPPRVQKAFEKLWLALDHASTANPTRRQYKWSSYIDRAKVEEDKMKLEFEMAAKILTCEATYKKKITKLKKEADHVKSWFMGSLVVIAILMYKILEYMYQC
uniref:Uncharacterized protein n=1 Tax=Oryza meridionalis TaxID=40149 RepID=A0A0E0EZQ0_9ORYZ